MYFLIEKFVLYMFQSAQKAKCCSRFLIKELINNFFKLDYNSRKNYLLWFVNLRF